MNPGTLLLCGIVFLAVGLLFAAAGFWLRLPSSVQKAPISRAAGTIFYIIGALTAICGLFAMAFHGNARKTAVELCLLAYLAAVIVLLLVFTWLVKGPDSR